MFNERRTHTLFWPFFGADKKLARQSLRLLSEVWLPDDILNFSILIMTLLFAAFLLQILVSGTPTFRLSVHPPAMARRPFEPRQG